LKLSTWLLLWLLLWQHIKVCTVGVHSSSSFPVHLKWVYGRASTRARITHKISNHDLTNCLNWALCHESLLICDLSIRSNANSDLAQSDCSTMQLNLQARTTWKRRAGPTTNTNQHPQCIPEKCRSCCETVQWACGAAVHKIQPRDTINIFAPRDQTLWKMSSTSCALYVPSLWSYMVRHPKSLTHV
jgi:hypothetical protein